VLRERHTRDRKHAERAVAERSPAQPDLPHRALPCLAFEDPDRWNAGDDQRDRAADPDAGREQVDDDDDLHC
jgi:hypothetical protein